MVNTSSLSTPDALRRTITLVGVYVAIVIATIVALAAMSAAGSHLATDDAWVHAVIVGFFALLLPLRLRSARRGSAGGLRAVVIIGAVLLVVNVVEALIPGLFPSWMRIEMVVIAILMAGVVATAARARRQVASR